jgi:pimeloyl-ACP methyl ester carboxylesterase
MDESRSAGTAAEIAAGRRPSTVDSDTSAALGTVVLVHGLWMPGWETWLLRHRLEAAGYSTARFMYRTVGVGLDDSTDELAAFAAGLPGEPVHFVGHSLGGALAVRLFERHRFERRGRIVCLGSPLKGSRPGAVLDSHTWGRRIVGRCMHDLLACGGCARWSGARDLGIIAGDVSLGFGRLLGGLASPNDGTVAVDETRLAGATDHVVLHCTHLSMLWSRAVAEQVVCFLRSGHFERSRRG